MKLGTGQGRSGPWPSIPAPGRAGSKGRKQETICILLVEDEEAHAELVLRSFEAVEPQYRLELATSLEQARTYLAGRQPDLVITDLVLPDGRGIELLPSKRNEVGFPLVVMTSQGDERIAVEAMKAGALDYIVKSTATFADLPKTVERILREWGHITERKRLEHELQFINQRLVEQNKLLNDFATRDQLTGIYNRRALYELAEQQWSRAVRKAEDYSVMLLDIDHFKRVNDEYGHLVGDRVLHDVAQTIDKLRRSYDYLGRWGGEEFMLVLPDTTIEQARIVAERMRTVIAETNYRIGDELVLTVTVSIGVASKIVSDTLDLDTLFEHADQALYRSKEAGRNKVTCFRDASYWRARPGST